MKNYAVQIVFLVFFLRSDGTKSFFNGSRKAFGLSTGMRKLGNMGSRAGGNGGQNECLLLQVASHSGRHIALVVCDLRTSGAERLEKLCGANRFFCFFLRSEGTKSFFKTARAKPSTFPQECQNWKTWAPGVVEMVARRSLFYYKSQVILDAISLRRL